MELGNDYDSIDYLVYFIIQYSCIIITIIWTTAKPVGTYTFTKIPGYEIKITHEQVQFKMYQFDTTPTAGSTNPVTSDGISCCVKEKVFYCR